MQTFITDFNFYKSASNLTRQHLQANIYESIQILASLLDCTDKLVNPKKNVKHYPQAQLWVGYERELGAYIYSHISEWENRGYKNVINLTNYHNITKGLERGIYYRPDWITDELIQTHRSVLIQKEIKKEFKINNKWLKYIIENEFEDLRNNIHLKKIEKESRDNIHYRQLWPDCPLDLKMRYNWRGKSV